MTRDDRGKNMEILDWLFIVITAFLCIVSFVLMQYDFRKNPKKSEAKKDTSGTETAALKSTETEPPEEELATAPISEHTPLQEKCPTAMLIYSAVMIVITLAISVMLCVVYTDNSFLFSLKRAALLSLLWPIGYIDYKTYRIPNLFILFGLSCRVLILIAEILTKSPGVWHTLLTEAIAAGALVLAAFLCTLCMKGSIGFGDIKLFAVMGLLLGTNGIIGAIFLTLIASFVISIVLLVTKKNTKKDLIPFGPAIVIGTFLSVFLTGM